MLESQSLLFQCVGSWPGSDPDEVGTISEPASGVRLGIFRSISRLPRWLRWMAPKILEICETEDRSLVCTLRGSRISMPDWVVFDADGKRVGSLVYVRSAYLRIGAAPGDVLGPRAVRFRGTVIEDRQGQCSALFGDTGQGANGPFLSVQGTELGNVTSGPEGRLLTFAPEVAGQPFLKMLLLATVLTKR